MSALSLLMRDPERNEDAVKLVIFATLGECGDEASLLKLRLLARAWSAVIQRLLARPAEVVAELIRALRATKLLQRAVDTTYHFFHFVEALYSDPTLHIEFKLRLHDQVASRRPHQPRPSPRPQPSPPAPNPPPPPRPQPCYQVVHVRTRVLRAIDDMLAEWEPRHLGSTRTMRGQVSTHATRRVVDRLLQLRGRLRLRRVGFWQRLARLAAEGCPLTHLNYLLNLQDNGRGLPFLATRRTGTGSLLPLSISPPPPSNSVAEEESEEAALDDVMWRSDSAEPVRCGRYEDQFEDQLRRGIWEASECACYLQSQPWAAAYMSVPHAQPGARGVPPRRQHHTRPKHTPEG